METKTYAPLTSFIDLLLDAICVVDVEGRFVFVSAACERIFGYTPEEMIGRAMIEMVVPEDRARTLQAANEIMSGQPKPHFENSYLRKDGQVVHIMWSARWSEADQLRVAVARDITKRKQAESMQAALYSISEAAHAAKDLLALFQRIHQIIGELLPALNFSVALYDEKNDQLSFPYHVDEHDQAPAPRKPDACTLCAEVIRTGQPLLLTAETLTALPEHLRAVGGRNSLCWLGVPLNSHKGTIGALMVKSYSGGARYTEKDKELLQFVSTQVAAAIERKQLHARLQYMAQYDQLTNLPNRALLHDRLRTALARARREQGRLSLLYLDLDKFKQVNDTFGHAAGDRLLQEVANRLKQCVREADTVARIGGDEFVVLLESIQVPEHASIVAEKIRSALNQPLDMEGHSLHILPSIGVALYPEHGDEEKQLLKHADEAMYFAKKNGGNRFQMKIEPSPSDDGAQTESPA
ncbi:diguanylate cyclase domain-containing protein [Pseudomonas sp. 2FE]|uniref:diguanylate cyclase domain-containing protein n=1 Tax=Pseudomonas sp. 2FE TaxID=2502190 RepID=UPI0010F474C2|nr:diguanylate cyclase [Pseudomonas sp. 2FE]